MNERIDKEWETKGYGESTTFQTPKDDDDESNEEKQTLDYPTSTAYNSFFTGPPSSSFRSHFLTLVSSSVRH